MSSTNLHQLTQEALKPETQTLSVESVQAILHNAIVAINDSEMVPLHDAFGRVLARDILSPINVPPHDNSAMDGYAFRGEQLTGTGMLHLSVIAERLAGHVEAVEVNQQECVRIMTGACMPTPCDTVIPHELCIQQRDASGKVIAITFDQDKIRQGGNRRRAGEDLAIGQVVAPAGRRLHAAELGLLASIGITEILVRRRLRVAYFSTGDEIRSVGQALPAGCIYDSNRTTLATLLRDAGYEVHELGVIPDQAAQLEAAMKRACALADVVLTSGGVSMGTADFTKQVMKELGDVQFWNIDLRPGRPMAFGSLHTQDHPCYLFGLPGNPVAAFLGFLFIVRPALQQLQGMEQRPLPLVQAIAKHEIRKRAGRTEYQRAIATINHEGRLEVASTGAQGSGILRSLAEANAILVLDESTSDIKVGDLLQIYLLHGFLSNH